MRLWAAGSWAWDLGWAEKAGDRAGEGSTGGAGVKGRWEAAARVTPFSAQGIEP